MTDTHNHDHNHDHEDIHDVDDLITLVDDEGNEVLFRIHLTIDGQEEFGKDYVLLYEASTPEGEEVELLAYAYEQEDGEAEGRLMEIETEAEWEMIEEVFNTFEAEELD
ncbi:DUF1292 domain-containing protein [Vagococcus carniphilus]|uniref:UPF0473 protein CBF28_05565 n=1 Tax=Vagococcus carniphilus TaxID=218144 RepID=A0A430B6E9_9ENTE|nr:DUF1292 domain-containing protein [Vagococcus carniphilus]MDT2815652.1 DUF1292 domain-containing protein [Vagococcus carniphilus]MDT2831201.1 DUF1292 domain-containing protein [Vagococcus carniphilus]MDT2834717.1 DUF1292 domain-containing protein [Vagococcus carniphilus]MDT2839640.1 DUF1292 domain-containing protein [Vagococcus carniphilus]MDT2848817.1 DUF1292 domain-containing protein [Vagococcus carniphilus]